MVLTVSFVLFPAIGLFVAVAARIAPLNLASASRCQNHDFAVRKRRIRLMHLTSIASRLTFRDDSAYAPLAEAGWAESIKLFLPRSEAKNFFIQGWTNVRSAARARTDLPVGQRGLRPAVGNDAVQCSPGQIGALSRRAGCAGRGYWVISRLSRGCVAAGHQLPEGRRSASLPPTRDGSLPPRP
jgi:hypothetical protein